MRISSFATCLFAIAIIGLAACGSDDDDGTPDAPPAELSCASYCTQIASSCTGGNQQYGSTAECMATCGHFPLGALADTTGNTLGCRTYHAGAAMTGPDTHCRHAGPGGDGACGANCLGFCTLVLGSCTGAMAQYNGDMSTCMTACAGYATDPPYSSMQTGGDSFACRLYHATAASANPGVHCSHTGATSPTCN
ncbi:MAG TPA: hypothetical protein VK932_16415 [Kofleriaceae bacterium]|nr:hypothetical protein [Kofleriaceae bacterium]